MERILDFVTRFCYNNVLQDWEISIWVYKSSSIVVEMNKGMSSDFSCSRLGYYVNTIVITEFGRIYILKGESTG